MSVAWTAVIIGGGAAILNGISQSNAAGDQRAYNAQVERLQSDYRLKVMNYSTVQYAKDTQFYGKQIAYEKDQFEQEKVQVQQSVDATNENFYTALATQMTKVVQQDMAEALGMQETDNQVLTETGALNASVADAGISGNTVNVLRGDIQRQGGVAKNITGMNADASRTQSMLEARGLQGRREAALASVNIPTFAPIQAPSPPAPVSPINPAAPVNGPSVGSIVLNGASAGINLGVGVQSFMKGLS